jgi:hypothetical protein
LAIYSTINFKKGKSSLKLYAIITFFVEAIGLYFLFRNKKPLSIIYNLHGILEIAIWMSYFLSLSFKPTKLFIIPITIVILTFLLIGDFNLLLWNTNGFLVGSISISSLIFLYYFQIVRNLLNLDGNFWISIGALFFQFGGFLLMGLVFLVAKRDPILGNSLYSLNTGINIVYYSLIFYGLFSLDKSEIKTHQEKI